MFKYQYKEKTYAEEILKNGFTSNHVWHELKILAKYYKEMDIKPKQRKEMIYSFCEKNLPGYDRVIHFKMINSVLNYAANKKNKLTEIESVTVSENELDFISTLGIKHDYKKILFTLLVLDKLNKKYHEVNENKLSDEHYFGGDKKYKELILSSKVTLKKTKDIHNIIGELANQRLLETVGKGNIKLSFIYNIVSDYKVGLVVSTFDNIGLYYDLYVQTDKVKECECCETPIKMANNKTKYCESCASIIKKEQNRLADNKYKNKVKIARK